MNIKKVYPYFAIRRVQFEKLLGFLDELNTLRLRATKPARLRDFEAD